MTLEGSLEKDFGILEESEPVDQLYRNKGKPLKKCGGGLSYKSTPRERLEVLLGGVVQPSYFISVRGNFGGTKKVVC